MMISAINLNEKFNAIREPWSPRLVAELNGQHVRIAKVQGAFIWHRHDDADELFYIVRGALTIELRDRHIALRTGELCVVPRGVEHRPVADDECWIMLFEPAGTRNTGNVVNERTVTSIPPA